MSVHRLGHFRAKVNRHIAAQDEVVLAFLLEECARGRLHQVIKLELNLIANLTQHFPLRPRDGISLERPKIATLPRQRRTPERPCAVAPHTSQRQRVWAEVGSQHRTVLDPSH